MSLKMPWKLEQNSDHAPFFDRGIPFLMMHTGLHDDYHRPSDDAHLINYDGMQHVARLTFDVVNELASLPQALPFRPESRQEQEPQYTLHARTVPQLAIDGEWIGGFNELTERHMEGELDGLMEK